MIVLFTYLAVIVIIGALVCFKGRDLFFPMIAILAFIFTFGIYISVAGTSAGNLIIGLILGLIAALLARFIYMVGVFLSGFLTGLLIGGMITAFLPASWIYANIILAIIIGVVIALLAVKWVDFFISFSTSASGASMMALPCCFMVMNISRLTSYVGRDAAVTIYKLNKAMYFDFQQSQHVMILLVTVVLFVIGMVVQMKTNSKMPRRQH